jgi:hypothetical protein
LEEIAEAMETDILDLLSFGEKNVLILNGDTKNSLYCFLQNVNFYEKQDISPIEIQKLHSVIEQQEKQISILEQEVIYLKGIIELLKEQQSK